MPLALTQQAHTSSTGCRRRTDRRGSKVVAQLEAPGDPIGAQQDVLATIGKTITDFAIEKGSDEIVVAMDERLGNLPVRVLLDAKLNGIAVIDLLEFLERESGKIRADLLVSATLLLKNKGLMLDLLIVLQTVGVVLWGNGARKTADDFIRTAMS